MDSRLADHDASDGGIRIEIFFNGDEVLRAGRMHRAEADGRFSAFVHDLAMRAVADWEAEQAEEPVPATAADETSLLIDVRFRGDEVLRIGRMHRAEADGKFSTFVHDLAMRAVADWEAEQSGKPGAVSAAD